MSKELEPLLTALNEVMKAAAHVTKNGYNDFHRYKYATEEDVLAVVRPAMVEHGLMLLPSLHGEPHTDQYGNTHLCVAYTLVHKSGAKWPEPIIVPGCGNDANKDMSKFGDKGTYKALTGANKYLLFKLFQIATGDDPERVNDQERGKPNGRKQPPANGQKAAPKNADDQKRAFLQKESYAFSMPTMQGKPCPDIWAGKFISLLPFCATGSMVDKLAGDNAETLDTLHAEYPDEGKRVTAAIRERQKQLQNDSPLAAE